MVRLNRFQDTSLFLGVKYPRVEMTSLNVRLSNESVAAICLVLARRRRRLATEARRWKISSPLEAKSSYDKFMVCYSKLRNNPSAFSEHYSLTIASFDELLSLIGDAISKTNTIMRECISPVEKLAVTLRYLSTGRSYRDLRSESFLGCSTIALIVRHTCKVMWNILGPRFLKSPDLEDYMEISDGFYRKFQFPHCVGSVGGKFIPIVKPWGNPNEFFLLKKQYCILLIAAVDSNSSFTYIDVGGFRQGGGNNPFRGTEMGKAVYSRSLPLPPPRPLPGDASASSVPYVFVTKEFAIGENVMRRFPRIKSKIMSRREETFNKSIDKVTSSVETAFSLLTTKWKIFHRPLSGSCISVDALIKGCCILHNFIGAREGFNYEQVEDCALMPIHPCTGGMPDGRPVREKFANYFCSS